ncbi:MAG: Gfo/Idh/MocA family oxidoreductase [Bacteroidota bacterium]
MIRFGILGTARIARAFFGTPLRGAEITAVASRSRARAERFAEAWGLARAYGGYAALLKDPDLDAVYVPLPQHLHLRWTLAAAAAGKHVLVEKPAALSSGDLQRMIAVCRTHRVLFMEALMYRFLRIHRRAREIVREGKVGELRYVDYNLSFDAWTRNIDGFRLVRRLGGGALYDLGMYAVDFLRFMTGGEPELVHARMRRHRGRGVDVFTHALFRSGKTVAALTVGFHADANYYTLAGSRGSVHAPVALSGRPDTHVLSVHLHEGNRRYEEVFPGENPYAREMEHFARCVEGRETPLLTPENSLRNHRIVEELFARSRPI